MKRKRLSKLLILLGTALLMTSCARSKKEETSDFSVFAVTDQGGRLEGIRSETDERWYLFVPSTENLEDLTLHCTGEIQEVSAGEADKTASVITHAFKESQDSVTIQTGDDSSYTVTVMQSGLPSVQISLNGVTLDEIHQNKDKKYKNNTFILKDPQKNYDLKVENGIEIKGRGNSSWRIYDKKGYQIKFGEKTSVLGMGKAKKWVLLANASDDSMIRTKLVYEMADKLDMGFVPSFEYVDFWVDGEYLGTYMIGEKVENGSSRLDLQNPTGALFEHDEGFYEEEEYSFYNKLIHRHFVLKEIEEESEENIEQAITDFNRTLDELMTYLYETPSAEVTLAELSKMIDADSFAKYFLINEYVQNQEAFATSFFWYQDGPEDVLHMGPIWDFDTCMGNDGASFEESYGQNHVLFRYLLAAPEFRAHTEELYEQNRKAFTDMKDRAEMFKVQISDSAAMNYLRWNVLGKPNPKSHARDFYATFPDAVYGVEEWLVGREEHFQIPKCDTASITLSDDGKWLNTCFDDEHRYDSVRFVALNTESDTNYVAWSTGERVNGVWQAATDLSQFGEAGLYRVDVYGDKEAAAAANGYHYVEHAVEKAYELEAELSENDRLLTVTLHDRVPCKRIFFAVWSEENGQDDLKWFEARRKENQTWEVRIDMEQYQSDGIYNIHAYEVGEESTLLDTMAIEISR